MRRIIYIAVDEEHEGAIPISICLGVFLIRQAIEIREQGLRAVHTELTEVLTEVTEKNGQFSVISASCSLCPL